MSILIFFKNLRQIVDRTSQTLILDYLESPLRVDKRPPSYEKQSNHLAGSLRPTVVFQANKTPHNGGAKLNND
jgi:hypothetical protein